MDQLCRSEASTHDALNVAAGRRVEPLLVKRLLNVALWKVRNECGLAR